MRNLNDVFNEYITGIKYVSNFINQHFGNENILEKKNSGKIADRDLTIKNSLIKGYIFHGYGCEFRFKKYTIDIEFLSDNSIAFSEWSFYMFCKKELPDISQSDIRDVLNEKQRGGIILSKGNDCFVPL